MNKPAIHPYIPIAIGVISVALSAIFVKLATADAGVIAFYRMFFSVLFMLPIFYGSIDKKFLYLQERIGCTLQLLEYS